MKKQIYIAIFALMGLLASCDHHEWPDLPQTDLYVELLFDFSDMPPYKTVDLTLSTRTIRHIPMTTPEMRYLVRCYALLPDGTCQETPEAQFTFLNSDLESTEYKCHIRLAPGNYRIKVWADYVDANTSADFYYNTTDFRDIHFTETSDNYTGSDPMRIAYIGEQDITVEKMPDVTHESNVSARITMQRPFAQFKFVTTDIPDFIEKYLGITDPDEAQRIDMSDYRVLFRYTGYLPTHFNLFNDRPFDAATGYQFFSDISELTATEATLGFDYVFVNGHESSVTVAVGIYDRFGMLLSFSDPIEVPLLRNHLTVVRGHFLTQGGSGNIGINPEFDGNHNIYIQD